MSFGEGCDDWMDEVMMMFEFGLRLGYVVCVENSSFVRFVLNM